MKKILISWLAFNNDFQRVSGGMTVDDEGPTMDFHRYHYEGEGYDRHYLLSAQKEGDVRIEHLYAALKRTFPDHEIEKVFRALDRNDVINHNVILRTLEPFLETISELQIDIFVSPGTPAMQTAWFILHMTKGLNTRLLQVRPKKFTESGQSELLEISIARDPFVSSATIKQVSQIPQLPPDDYLLTPSLSIVYDMAARIAHARDVDVLITGPSGSGKEHLAHHIHDESSRKNSTFKAINCAAFADELLRSELFGHEKGAFTGAEKKKIGIIQECEDGTVFLDEIGDISPFMQQALLRVLQQKEIMPVGSSQSIPIDARFIAATNVDLIAKCEKGLFRWDLFYRLAVVELELPSVFERGLEEIKMYIDFFIKSKAKKFRQSRLELSKAVKQVLYSYPWPGNIRELENVIERLYVLSENNRAEIKDLPPRIINSYDDTHPFSLRAVEKQHIEKVLKFNDNNQNKTSRDLGIVINTLRKKIKEYGIQLA